MGRWALPNKALHRIAALLRFCISRKAAFGRLTVSLVVGRLRLATVGMQVCRGPHLTKLEPTDTWYS